MYGETNMYGEWKGIDPDRENAGQMNGPGQGMMPDPGQAASGQIMPGPGQPGGGPMPPYQQGPMPPHRQGPGPGTPLPAGAVVPIQVRNVREVKIGEKLEKMLDRFGFFGIGCIVYGILFTICIYPGFHGISMPVISGITMFCLVRVCGALDIPLKKSTWFYFVSWGLLSVSSMLTTSLPMIAFNTCGIFLLFLSFLFAHFCNTKNWGFGKYLGQIFIAPFLAMGYILYPFQSLERYLKHREQKGKSSVMRHVWLGIAISLPLLVVLTLLLVSADAVFRSLIAELFRAIRFPARPFWMCLLLFAGVIASYGLLAYLADGKIADAAADKKRWEPVVGISFLSVLTVLYLLFSTIQISYLFVGGFRLPEGYSYSSYAREGFFQLLIVCLINLVIILLCISRFREHRILKGVLTIFSCCTYIMIASSAMRMLLYVGMHHLTFLRLLVLWALVLLTVLLTGCIVTIYKNGFPLFQFAMVTVTVFYIGFSLARPDYQIAKYNLAHDREAVSSDSWYWFKLSSDAIPALEAEGVLEEMGWRPDLPDNENTYALRMLQRKLDAYREMGFRDFNYSCYRAGKILESYGTQ